MAESDSNKPVIARPRSLFIAYDTTVDYLKDCLGVLVDSGERIRDMQPVVLARTPGQGSIPERVLTGIREADAFLGVLDRPNANVGFELGYALGNDKPSWLMRFEDRAHGWLKAPPLAELGVPSFTNTEELRNQVGQTEALRPPGAPATGGSEVLFLCPTSGRGATLREKVKTSAKGWTAFDHAAWSLTDLPKRLDRVGTVVWAYVPPDPNKESAERDGIENAILAILAGYARGSGRSLKFWHYGDLTKTRTLVDVSDSWREIKNFDAIPAAILDVEHDRAANEYRAAVEDYRTRAADAFRTFRPLGFEGRFRIDVRLDELFFEMACRHRISRASGRDGLGEMERHGGIPLTKSFDPIGTDDAPDGVLLLGEPGAGKTTQLRRLLRWVAPARSADARGALDGAVPFLVSLRDINPAQPEAELTPEAIAKRAIRAAGAQAAAGRVRDILEREKPLFLLDGLDEIRDSNQRAAVAKAVVKLSKTARVIATCRFAGYDAVKSTFENRFLLLEVPSLTKDQAEAFVLRWYQAVETAGDIDDREKRLADAAQKAAELNASIAAENIITSKRLQDLSGNPLLLTAVCLVHRDLQRLPIGRGELYELCVKALIELWTRNKEVKLDLDAAKAQLALQRMALWLHQETDRQSATVDQLRAEIEPTLRRHGWRTGLANFLAHIRDETGLLTDAVGGGFKFLHLCFQEYLAACEIQRRAIDEPERIDSLASHFGESWWQEVAGILVALKGSDCFHRYFRSVVRNPSFGDTAHTEVARSCVRDARDPTPEPFVDCLLGEEPTNDGAMRCHIAAATIVVDRFPDEVPVIRERFVETPHKSDYVLELFGVAARTPLVTVSAPEVFITPNGGCELVRIPAGTFLMGSPESEANRQGNEGPQHRVTLTRDFYIGRFPVTNAQYALFLRSHEKPDVVEEPSHWRSQRFNEPDQPVVGVSWDDATAFCVWAGTNTLAPLEGRLPTEAQWEYACRAGTETPYWSGNDVGALDQVGWFDKNTLGRTKPVGLKPANRFGLHDTHGSVWEWCADPFGPYGEEEVVDPSCGDSVAAAHYAQVEALWVDGAARVLRGGSWGVGAARCRSAARFWSRPDFRFDVFGFRLALSVIQPR